MTGSRFDRLALIVGNRSHRVARRAALGAATLAATEWLVGPATGAAKKKKKKAKPCPACPPCPAPPPPPSGPFCAGKNHCDEEAPCNAPDAASGCFCYLRADNLKSMCGQLASFVGTCASCTGGFVCVVLGGACAPGFGCAIACPDPR